MINTTLLHMKHTLISHRLLSRAWHRAGSSSSITYGSVHVSEENKIHFQKAFHCQYTTSLPFLFFSFVISVIELMPYHQQHWVCG